MTGGGVALDSNNENSDSDSSFAWRRYSTTVLEPDCLSLAKHHHLHYSVMVQSPVLNPH